MKDLVLCAVNPRFWVGDVGHSLLLHFLEVSQVML